jgi:hypothetical protein
MDSEVRNLAEKIWTYHHLHHDLASADAILVLCSHDTAVADRGAQLFLDGYAPLLIFSGGLGGITKQLWTEPEADRFAAIARAAGVPADRILVENRSTNTGENVAFTRALLAERGLDPQTFILVQKPYMERRTFATFRKVWPEKTAIVTSPRVTFDDYVARYSNARCQNATSLASWLEICSASASTPREGSRLSSTFPTTYGPRSQGSWSLGTTHI